MSDTVCQTCWTARGRQVPHLVNGSPNTFGPKRGLCRETAFALDVIFNLPGETTLTADGYIYTYIINDALVDSII